MHTPIAIVGGGPCGLALALQLAHRKIPCVVFERSRGCPRAPYQDFPASIKHEHNEPAAI